MSFVRTEVIYQSHGEFRGLGGFIAWVQWSWWRLVPSASGNRKTLVSCSPEPLLNIQYWTNRSSDLFRIQ